MDPERYEQVRQAVLTLPLPQQRLIELFHYQHRSYLEIANILDLPIGTIKSRLNRARLTLRRRLSDSDGGASAPVGAVLWPVPPTRSGHAAEVAPRDSEAA
jgi:DNA-directed RNA polymerase specialized sigma24 family protein